MEALISAIPDSWLPYMILVGGVVTGASLILNVVAKFTKNTTDDKFASWGRKLAGWAKIALERLALNVK